MTHNCLTHEYKCRGLLSHIYTNVWKDSDYYMYFNFGTIEVARINNSTVSVTMHIRDIEGKIVVTKTLKVKKDYQNSHLSK
jgi:hypothetical protein